MKLLYTIIIVHLACLSFSQKSEAFYTDNQTIKEFSFFNSKWFAVLDLDHELVVINGSNQYTPNPKLLSGERITHIDISGAKRRTTLNLLTQVNDADKGLVSRLHIANLKRGKFRFNKCITLDKVYHEIISTSTFLALKNSHEILFIKQNSVSKCEYCVLSSVNDEGLMLFSQDSLYRYSNKGELLQESEIEKDVIPIFVRDSLKIYYKDNRVIYQNNGMIKEINQGLYPPLFVLGFNSKYLIFFDNVGAWLIDYRKSTFSLRFLGSNVHEIETTEEKYYLSIDNFIYEVDW